MRFTAWKLLFVLAIALAGLQEWQRNGLASAGIPGCGGVCGSGSCAGAVRCELSPRRKAHDIDQSVPAARLDCPESSRDCENSSESDLGPEGACAARTAVSFGLGYWIELSPGSVWTSLKLETKPLLATSRFRC